MNSRYCEQCGERKETRTRPGGGIPVLSCQTCHVNNTPENVNAVSGLETLANAGERRLKTGVYNRGGPRESDAPRARAGPRDITDRRSDRAGAGASKEFPEVVSE